MDIRFSATRRAISGYAATDIASRSKYVSGSLYNIMDEDQVLIVSTKT